MKTRTAAFDRAWADRRTRFALYRVELYRRYWNGSAFVREVTPIIFRPKAIDTIGAITRRFDESKTGIKFSNVSIGFKNLNWYWLPSNVTTGIWRPDSVALLGYEPVDSEVRLYYGYKLHDDAIAVPSTESLAMFTGLIEDDPVLDFKSGVASITIIGKAEAMLKGKTATAVCTTLTNQATSPATGDASNRTFSGALKSVWEMSNVRSNAVVKTQGDGADYQLGDLNDAEVAASIQFNSTFTPGAGHVILWDGKQWHRDKAPSTLIGLLCDAAGITAGNRVIEEPIFPNVDQRSDLDTEAHWAAGSGTQFETASLPGTLRRRWFKIDDFTDNDYTASPAWTIRYNESADTVSAATGALVVTVDGNPSDLHIDTPVDERDAYGSWEFTLRTNGNPGDTGSTSNVNFIQYGAGTGGVGYRLKASLATGRWTLVRVTPAEEPLLDVGACDTASHTWRITRTSAGLFTLYRDGVSVGTFTDTTYTLTNYFGFRATYSQNGGTPMVSTLDAIYWSNAIVDIAVAVSDADMDFESDQIDLLAAPTAFLPLAIEEVLNGGSRTIKTRTATVSGGPYDAAVAVDATLTPQSALKRYFKLVIQASRLAGAFSAPEFARVSINWRGNNLFIQSADFTGMNCLEAAQAIAERCGMEHGTEDDGSYFFRNRTVAGAADLVLTERNAVIDISNYTTGKKEVRNIAQVRYGKSGTDGYYFAEYKASNAGEASPTTAQAIGEKVIEIVADRFLFSNNANVAAAIAQKFYTELYRPKRRFRARCRIIPHLEISDKVLISANDSPLIANVIFGDPLQDFPAMGPTNTLAREILMKVVGKTDDIIKAETLLDLEEILS